MIEAALCSILLNDTVLYGLVGTRVFPVELPLDCALPALAYSEISNPHRRITGNPRFQIDIFSEDYTESKTVKGALEAALDGYSGVTGGHNIEIIVPLDSSDFYDSETGIYHISYDFKIIFRK